MSLVRNYVINSVIVPATSFDVTTLLNVKTDLGLQDGDPAIDIYLKRVIRQTSASMAQYCNRVFALQTYKDVFRPQQDIWPGTLLNRESPIALTQGPVVTVTSIVTRQNGTDTTLVVGDDYEIDPKTGEIYRLDSNGDPRGWDAIKTTVVYTAGWTLPGKDGVNQLLDTAPDIEDACIRLIKARYLARDRDPYLRTDEVTGVGTQTYWIPDSPTGNLPTDVQDILDNYRFSVMG